MILLVFFVFIILLIFLKKQIELFTSNPCEDYLNNKDYLIHMIPHHQVAIDMCNLMKPITKSKTLQNIYRVIIWNQQIEIKLMTQILNGIPNLGSSCLESLERDTEFKTSLSLNSKSKPKNYRCDPLFFDPNEHSNHMKHMKHTDLSCLEHMIPHHQVAVDMSNRLLKYTKNTHMIRLCYDIITAQRAEILKMNYILEYMKKNKLEFLPEYY